MQWLYNPQGWKRSEKNGVPYKRLPGTPLPCRSCPKSEDGHPNPGAEISEKNLMAYRHYQRCKAVGRFPVDAIVEQNAGIIRTLEDQVSPLAKLERMVAAYLGVKR